MKYSIEILQSELKEQEHALKEAEEDNKLSEHREAQKNIEDLSYSIETLKGSCN